MLVQLRSTERMRGPKALDVAPVMSAVLEACREGTIDLSRLRVTCDWMQYKQNFREPVAVREILPSAVEAASRAPGSRNAQEVAIDLRRAKPDNLSEPLKAAMSPAEGGPGHVYIEPWGLGTQSCIWGFNALYWAALSLWEEATGRGYEAALPGGESDARNSAAARDLILDLFATWDRLAARRALPDELHVLEVGVGNGNQAKVWLDEFRKLDRERGGDYYRRLHYLMGDYSSHVLDLARENVKDHADHVSGLVLDATRPMDTLGFLRHKAFLVYISNVYDNLPTDEIARLSGSLYHVEVRAYLAAADAERVAQMANATKDQLPDLVSRLLRLGPELLAESARDRFPDKLSAVRFWQAVYESLRLDERYVPLESLDKYEVAPGVSGETLRPIAESNGDMRMHVSNGAAASFADTLPLLHPHGILICHDLFVTGVHQYATGFRGPGKYDGSVVNWVNGPVLEAIGSRRGFDVAVQPFAHREGANVWTLTAKVRD